MPTVLDDILATARDTQWPPDSTAVIDGLRALLRLSGTDAANASPALADYLIALVDGKISEQVNAILHHRDFMALESTWRGLRFLADRLDFSQNILLEYINVSKDDLLRDFQDSPEVVKSGLYRHIYTAEFGQFGGIPVAAVIAGYTLTPGPQDMQLLQYAASVASMAHAPLFAAAGKEFFGLDEWRGLPDIKDLPGIFDSPRYARWNSFRESPNARYVGLALPGFLLRLPYGEDGASAAASFNFTEETDREDAFCWGNTAFALADRLGDSFAKYRWCVNIIGPDGGGRVENLPCSRHQAMRGIQDKIPTRAIVTERREFELAELGFIPLVADRTRHEAVFFSANSALKPKTFPQTAKNAPAEINSRLSTQFPYMMLMNRLAHYLKVLQRENMGSWRGRGELALELNKWISRYVTAMDTPDALTRSKRPLRMAHVDVRELENEAGWYAVTVLARPHFKYMGVNFTLSLEGRLERQTPGDSAVGNARTP
ncbi:MAG: type VI secretion system contractile sheath large subunit [Desulfovibrio sp.]|jgi:type VI secretion system protein ImpC|nr:type VI secretion system contractile sheath large subunit [Desulfovibrio sp.]